MSRTGPPDSSVLHAEGRVVIPAAIRRLLGVGAGDRVLFIPDDRGRVQLVSPNVLIMSLWAHNHGAVPGGGGSGDRPGDAADEVRARRDADQLAELDRLNEPVEADARTDDDILAEVLASLDLSG